MVLLLFWPWLTITDCTPLVICTHNSIIWSKASFHTVMYWCTTQCEKVKNLVSPKNLSWNQLFYNFLGKNVAFTKYLFKGWNCIWNHVKDLKENFFFSFIQNTKLPLLQTISTFFSCQGSNQSDKIWHSLLCKNLPSLP